MPLQDPVVLCSVETNTHAEMIRDFLIQAGVEAHLTENMSGEGGTVLGGLVSPAQGPQVWVERTDAERATALLDELEQQRTLLAEDAPDIETVCEECGGKSTFPASDADTVQTCPHCGAYMDVGAGGESPEDWGEPEEESASDEDSSE